MNNDDDIISFSSSLRPLRLSSLLSTSTSAKMRDEVFKSLNDESDRSHELTRTPHSYPASAYLQSSSMFQLHNKP